MLTHEAPSASAECCADGNFFASRRGASDQQIGDVKTGDEENAAGGSQQDVEWRLEVVYDVLKQEAHVSAEADGRKVRAVLLAEVAADVVDFAKCLFEGDTGFQSSDGIEAVVVESRQVFRWDFVVEGSPDFGLRIGIGKPGRHDADDGVARSVKQDLGSDDGGVATEATLPEAPRKHYGGFGLRLIVGRIKHAPIGRLDA